MEPTLRADRFAILKSTAACHECGADILVAALLVPEFRQSDEGEWIACEESAVLTYVEAVDDATAGALLERAP